MFKILLLRMLDKVTVAVKCRPVTSKETGEEIFDFFKEDTDSVTTLRNKMKFKHVFTPESTTREVFEMIVTPIMEKSLLGYNGTILAYGQTGSGKTYTLGTELMEPGITEMLLEQLFKNSSIGIKLSVVEVYLKDCFDLFHSKPLKLNIQGLKPVCAALVEAINLEKAKELLKAAMKNRRVGTTAFNEKSSRSHVIISVVIETNIFISKLNIVDLAGSEKIVASAGTLRSEGVAINEALLSLGRVVNCLALAKPHIPFRDSTLTHLLEDSLNNNNYIALIACINSMKKNLEESEKTLDFASKFAGISASRVIATPFKTPRRFVNNTFSTGNTGFKKPLTPLNKTIATMPVYWQPKKREKPENTGTPIPDIRRDTLNSSNMSLNLSNISSSTTLPEFSSPPQNRVDSLPSAMDKLEAMTPAYLDTFIKKTVERAIRSTIKREMTQLFKRQRNVFDQKENTQRFAKQLLNIEGVHAALDDFSPAHDSSSDSDCLQTTVLVQSEGVDMVESESLSSEPVSELPKSTKKKVKENINGSYISDAGSPDLRGIDEETDQRAHHELSNEKSAVRRSYRLSKSSAGTPDRRGSDTDSSLNSAPDLEVPWKPVHLCMRRSALRRAFEERASDEAYGDRSEDSDQRSHYESNKEISKRPTVRRSSRLSILRTNGGGDNPDISVKSEPRSDMFLMPPPRRSVRRSVLKKQSDERRSDKTVDITGTKNDSNILCGEEYAARAPRRSMRLSIVKRPFEETEDTPYKKAKSSRVPTVKIGPSKKKEAKSVISLEENVLRILREGNSKELQTLSTVGQKTAALVLNDRLLHGPLKSVNDFSNIRGITENQGKKFLWANSLV